MTEPTAAWQLPDGVDELLPNAAWRVDQLRRQFTDCCRHSGYELVMPPLIEYIDALLTGTGEATSLQTFKVVDQQSGRTLGVRADMTPQVARMDAHVLRSDKPSRLCYTGTVLRARTDGFGGSRTPQQFGAEIFGHASDAADIEIIRLMLDTASLAGLPNDALVLDLGHVGVYQGLCNAASLSDEQQEKLYSAMHRGSLPDMNDALNRASCSPGIAEAFKALLNLRGGQEVCEQAKITLLSDEITADLPPEATHVIQNALTALTGVVDAIERSHPQVRIVLDFADIRGYRYHTGMLFAAYTRDGRVIARGGRYDAIGTAFGKERPATGFSGDLTQLARLAEKADPALATAEELECIGVPNLNKLSAENESSLWHTIRQLRSSGKRVVVALSDEHNNSENLSCSHQLIHRDGDWCVEPISHTS